MHDYLHTGTPQSEAALQRSGPLRGLKFALVVTALLLAVQAAGGLISGSLALLADAAHLLADLGCLLLSFAAARLAVRPATPRRSYGLYRVEILAAMLNGIVLLVLSGFIVYEAFRRLGAPEPVKPGWMIGTSLLALAGNLASLKALHPSALNLNIRAAYLEVLADTLGSLSVLAAALLILSTGWMAADPVLSALLGLAIVPRTLRLLADASHVLLEGTPPGLDHAAIEADLLALAGVAGVHDLHVWSLTSGVPVLTAHVVAGGSDPCDDLLERISSHLKAGFGIDHATIQIEHVDRLEKEDDRF